MRTVGDILEAVKDGEQPSFDEMKYCLLAIEALHFFNLRAIKYLSEDKTLFSPKKEKEEALNRMERCLNTGAKEYVGWENDPDNPDFQKNRKNMKKLLDKLSKTVSGAHVPQ